MALTRIPSSTKTTPEYSGIQLYISWQANDVIGYFSALEKKFTLFNLLQDAGNVCFFGHLETSYPVEDMFKEPALLQWYSNLLKNWNPIFDEEHIIKIRQEIRDFLFAPISAHKDFKSLIKTIIKKNPEGWKTFFADANELEAKEFDVEHYFVKHSISPRANDLYTSLCEYLAGAMYFALQSAWQFQNAKTIEPELSAKNKLLPAILNNCSSPSFILAKLDFDLRKVVRLEIAGIEDRIKDKELGSDMAVETLKSIIHNNLLFIGLGATGEKILADGINVFQPQLNQLSVTEKRGLFKQMRERVSTTLLPRRKSSVSSSSPRPADSNESFELPAILTERDPASFIPGERLRHMHRRDSKSELPRLSLPDLFLAPPKSPREIKQDEDKIEIKSAKK